VNIEDTFLRRVAANTLGTEGDFKFTSITTGPILVDRTTGNNWRLKVDSGVLSVELAS
jgi:hypothetical protein